MNDEQAVNTGPVRADDAASAEVVDAELEIARFTNGAAEGGADGRLDVRRQRQAAEQVRQAVEAARVQHRQHDHERGEQEVGEELERVVEGERIPHA